MRMGDRVTACAWIRGWIPVCFVSLNDLEVPKVCWLTRPSGGAGSPDGKEQKGLLCEVPTIAKDCLTELFC